MQTILEITSNKGKYFLWDRRSAKKFKSWGYKGYNWQLEVKTRSRKKKFSWWKINLQGAFKALKKQ